MTTFQEFLKQKAGPEFDLAIRRDRQEWVDALRTLRDQLKGWVKELDPDGYLLLRDREYPKFDRRLGRFDAPGLEIGLGRTKVEVEPGVRYPHSFLLPPAAPGRFDGPSLGPSEGTAVVRGPSHVSYTLHRFLPAGGATVWVVEERPTGFRGSYPVPLDREQFALVLQDLLA